MSSLNARLIIDVGMSEGNDTQFYLRKGFSVIGVEADPTLYDELLTRFAPDISAGRLTVLNRAAAGVSGAYVDFWHNSAAQGHSGLRKSSQSTENDRHSVLTIAWPELKSISGIPYYLKMDIEGAEPDFMRSVLGEQILPTYASAECQNFQPIDLFHQMGYRKFRLINQIKHAQFPIPNPPLEGNYVPMPGVHHWSGLFGRELPGRRWFSFDEISEIHRKAHELWTYETILSGWIDCHVTTMDAD